jgi:adenylate cyclase
VWLGAIFNFAGRPEEVIGVVEKALRLNPHDPFFYLFNLGFACRVTGRHEEAVTALQRACTLNPEFLFPHIHLAALYSELGREEEARAEAAEVLRISPDYSLEVVQQILPFKDQAELERLLDGLRKAGLK